MSTYATRQAVFDAAHTIMDATNKYEGEARIEKWAVVIAAHKLNGNDKIPKPSKTRFALSEDDLTKSKQLSDRIVLGITAGESIALQQEKEHAAEVMADTPAIPDAIIEKARRTYESGEFISYCEKAFDKVWYGDKHILKGILLVNAVSRVLNAEFGIHLHIKGSTQTGKSQSTKKCLKFIHNNDVLRKTFSDQYLYHAGNKPDMLHRRMIVFSDDTCFSPETAGIFRGILTSWNEGSNRGIVKNLDALDLHIPPRISLILTSIDEVCQSSDDAQDESRFLSLEVRRTNDDMKKIKMFVQQDKQDITHELAVIQEVWNIIGERNVTRHKKISGDDLQIREFHRYLELVCGHALLCGRTETNDDDYQAIDDFLSNASKMINSETSDYTRLEKSVLSVMSGTNPEDTMDANEIATAAKITTTRVYHAIHGKTGSFDKPIGGLLSKCVAFRQEMKFIKGQNNTRKFWLEMPLF